MFDRFSVAQRLAFGFCAIIFTQLIAGFVIWQASDEVDTLAQTMASASIPIEKEANDLRDHYFHLRLQARNAIMANDEKEAKKETERNEVYKERLLTGIETVERYLNDFKGSEENARLARDIRTQYDLAIPKQDHVFALAIEQKPAEAKEYLNKEARPRMKDLEHAIEAYVDYTQKRLVERAALIVTDANHMRNLSTVAILLSSLIALIFGFIVTRSIRKPLDETVSVMERIAACDLTARVDIDTTHDHELARLQNATMTMVGEISAMLRAVQQQSTELNGAAANLKDASTQVLQGSENQSEATSSMAAALEQISTSINHVSDLAIDAQRISTESGEAATSGAQSIRTMVDDIGRIAEAIQIAAHTATELKDASQRISGITNVIKDVADQTNLLALNAAIEAARAGEAGRGFAVVADEVRKLAEKTSTSAQEIASMVTSIQSGAEAMAGQMQESVLRVDEGKAMAETAGQSVDTIVGSAGQVVHVIDDVSRALKEQAVASQDIASRVESIVQMIEENNASMGSVAETAHQLDGLASRLREDTARFRLA